MTGFYKDYDDVSGVYVTSAKAEAEAAAASAAEAAAAAASTRALTDGEGIDIIGNVISIDSTVVTLEKEQTLENKHIDAGNF